MDSTTELMGTIEEESEVVRGLWKAKGLLFRIERVCRAATSREYAIVRVKLLRKSTDLASLSFYTKNLHLDAVLPNNRRYSLAISFTLSSLEVGIEFDAVCVLHKQP